ncbi:MAG TPA: NMD3-related protein [Candidatus Norongarragalinales archaeon]|jgi:nonsense-mediated mRNA decay protein 3|nr:NMD3-related protein [Candidatus Norongarragalinales archaeon]
MTSQSKICPRCGHDSSDRRFIGSFCEKCFQETQIIAEVPKALEIDLCKTCGRVKLKNEWTTFTGKSIAIWLDEKIKHQFKVEKKFIKVAQHPKELECDIDYTYIVHGVPIDWKAGTRIPLHRTYCPDDMKMAGGYYEAIVQLRGDPKDVAKEERELARHLHSYTYIAKTEHKKEGPDIYIGNKTMLQRFFEDNHVRFEASRRLMGQKQGKRLFLTTYLIRLSEKETDAA